MNRERISDRSASMRYCYEMSNYLLTAPVPVSADVADDASEVEAAIDEHRYKCAAVSYLLNTIVFEIGIKILWEIDIGSKPPNTHNIAKLFEGSL